MTTTENLNPTQALVTALRAIRGELLNPKEHPDERCGSALALTESALHMAQLPRSTSDSPAIVALKRYIAAVDGYYRNDPSPEIIEDKCADLVAAHAFAEKVISSAQLPVESVKSTMKTIDPDPIHGFFGLGYASYLVLPRTLLQSCSTETQQALVEALERVYQEEKANMPHHWPDRAKIIVQLQDCGSGRFIKDDLADYQRGRRRLWEGTK